jgi:fluoride exporter
LTKEVALRDVLYVAVGGSLGALARYGTGLAAAHWLGKGFPWGTLAVNVAGCFVMGIVMELLQGLEAHSREAMTPAVQLQIALWHRGLAIGFLGGLTTFSTFGGDTLRQFQSGQPGFALANIAANVLLSLAAVWCGLMVMRALS